MVRVGVLLPEVSDIELVFLDLRELSSGRVKEGSRLRVL